MENLVLIIAIEAIILLLKSSWVLLRVSSEWDVIVNVCLETNAITTTITTMMNGLKQSVNVST